MPEIRSWHQHAGTVIDTVNGFEVIECEYCGFKHILPIPTEEELDLIYREEYYTVEKPLYLERHREDLDWWNLVYSERYNSFEELLPPDRRRILDVGSGPGFFLLHGKERGWQTYGIEPSAQAAAHSRNLGLNIMEDFFKAGAVTKLGRFDVIHISQVLEHVPDPVHIIQLAKQLLNAEGLLCVVVPNDYSPLQLVLRGTCGYKPWWVAPPHHINYFDFNSLTALLQREDFEIILRDTTFPMDLFLLMGENYIGNDALGRYCHAKRKALEKTLEAAGMGDLKKNLYRQMAGLGIGREVVLIGRVSRGGVL